MPAGFPNLIPGSGLVMLGAIQHAPQLERHSMLHPSFLEQRVRDHANRGNRALIGHAVYSAVDFAKG